ncbi:hypothetical protein RB595_001855 [Gaeumannomyces hyphopodioides]
MVSELPSDGFSEMLSVMGDEELRGLAAVLESGPVLRAMHYAARRALSERDLASTTQAVGHLSIRGAPGGGTDATTSPDGDLRELLDNMEDEELRQFVVALEDELSSQAMASAVRRGVFERDLETRIQWTEDVWFACLLGTMEASGRVWSFLVDPHIAGSLPFIVAFEKDLADDDECHEVYYLLLQREASLVTIISCPDERDKQEGSVQQFLGNWFDEIVTLDNAFDTESYEYAVSYHERQIADLDDGWRRFTLQCSLRNIKWHMYQRVKTEASLGAAIEAAEKVVPAASQGPNIARKPDALFMLGRRLAWRWAMQPSPEEKDLSYAIRCLEKAADGLASPYRQRHCLGYLSALLYCRYKLIGTPGDLRDAVASAERSRDLIPNGSDGSKHDETLANQMFCLSHSIVEAHETKRYGEASLQEAQATMQHNMDVIKEALELAPPSSDCRRYIAVEYVNSFIRMFRLTGSLDLLNRAVEFQSRFERPESKVPAFNNAYWGALASLLYERHLHTGAAKDIFDATAAARKALAALDGNNLDIDLRLESMSRLTSVLYEQSTVDRMLPDAENKAKQRQDINEAMRLLLESIKMSPANSQQASDYAHCLSIILNRRSRLCPGPEQEVKCLYQAAALAEYAVASTSEGDTNHIMYRHNLADIQSILATNPPDGAAAISELRATAHGTSDADHEKASRLNNLGRHLMIRFRLLGAGADLDGAIDAFESCTRHTSTTGSLELVTIALRAAKLLVKHKADFRRADGLLRGAVAQLRRVSPRSLHQADQQQVVRRFAGLATLAAATALEVGAEPSDALALLEEGRCIILGLLFEVRSDVAALRANPQYAADADEFERLRDALDTRGPGDARAGLASAPASLSAGGDMSMRSFAELPRREQLAKEFDALVEKIQGFEGFEDFMRTPHVTGLQRAAAGGPIVVLNVSKPRCDALIVHHDRGVELVPLPGLKHEDIKTWSGAIKSKPRISEPKMFEMLAWLWDELALPVLTRLEEVERSRAALAEKEGKGKGKEIEELPRVWWIPTGDLCLLPIHAAGRYGPGAAPSDTLLERILSSYSPSIKTLLFVQRNRLRGSTQAPEENQAPTNSQLKALVVAMEETEGLGTLAAARVEAKAVCKELNSLCPARPTITANEPPSTEAATMLMEPEKAAVVGLLRDAGVLHFAGHGQSDPYDPLKSALLLRDWQEAPFTVADVIDEFRRHERPRFLAYLSACLTGSSHAKKLSDEGLHLMSAFQLAGFQHVVGSLWEVPDGHCIGVARSVYASLARGGLGSDRAVVRGLRDGVWGVRNSSRPRDGVVSDGAGAAAGSRDGHSISDRAARSKLWRGGDPRVWAAYIHMGP